MRISLPLALLPMILVSGAAPVWSQAGGGVLQGPAPWIPSGTLEATGRWSTAPSITGAGFWAAASGVLSPPSSWRRVTDLKPLSLGSSPPEGGHSR